MSANELQKAAVPAAVPATAEDRKELVSHDQMVTMVKDALSDLDLVKKEALEAFYIFKDLLTNEGEGSSATKEQMGTMLQIYLGTVDTRLKTVDLMLKSKKTTGPKAAGPAAAGAPNINILGGMSRREVIEEIERIMETSNDPEITVEAVEVKSEER